MDTDSTSTKLAQIEALEAMERKAPRGTMLVEKQNDGQWCLYLQASANVEATAYRLELAELLCAARNALPVLLAMARAALGLDEKCQRSSRIINAARSRIRLMLGEEVGEAPEDDGRSLLAWVDAANQELNRRADAVDEAAEELERLRERVTELEDSAGNDIPTPDKLRMSEERAESLLRENQRLQEWIDGATAASYICWPANTGPHTEEVFCTHKERYLSGSEEYRQGADLVSAAALQVRKRPPDLKKPAGTRSGNS